MIKDMNKIKKFVFPLCLVFLLFYGAFKIFEKKEYEVSYDVDGYHVIEAYHKNLDYYSFVFSKDNQTFYEVVDNQSFFDKKIVTQVEEVKEGQEICILAKSIKVRFDYLCRNGEEQISKMLVSGKMKSLVGETNEKEDKLVKKDDKIEIYDSLEDVIYLWNYKGFLAVSSDGILDVPIFSKDIYQPSLITQVNSTLVIPDYASDYFFNKLYLLDMNSQKVRSVELPEKIYFDSKVLGVYENSLYLVDKHEEKEWKFDVLKKKLERVGNSSVGSIYNHGFEEVSMNKLLYQDLFFEGVSIVDYENKNGAFYEVWNGYFKKVKNSSVKEIVGRKNGNVYYLIDDTLYSYNEEDGEKKLLVNFEWNFNSSHVVFVL